MCDKLYFTSFFLILVSFGFLILGLGLLPLLLKSICITHVEKMLMGHFMLQSVWWSCSLFNMLSQNLTSSIHKMSMLWLYPIQNEMLQWWCSHASTLLSGDRTCKETRIFVPAWGNWETHHFQVVRSTQFYWQRPVSRLSELVVAQVQAQGMNLAKWWYTPMVYFTSISVYLMIHKYTDIEVKKNTSKFVYFIFANIRDTIHIGLLIRVKYGRVGEYFFLIQQTQPTLSDWQNVIFHTWLDSNIKDQKYIFINQYNSLIGHRDCFFGNFASSNAYSMRFIGESTKNASWQLEEL